MSIVVFDDTDTQAISYSKTWTGYQGKVGNIDATQGWVGSSFHACRAEPLNASLPCWANITFTGSAITLYSEYSNWQQRFWCGLVDEGDYRWYNASTLAGQPADAPFVWSLNHTRCSVSGLDHQQQHTLAFGQLAQDTQSIGVTLDYVEIDQGPSNSKDNQPVWSSDFVTVDTPPDVNWATSTSTGTTSTGGGSSTRSATSTSSTSSASVSPSKSLPSSASSASNPSDTSNASAENSSSSSGGGGGVSSTAATGIGLGVGLGGLALLVLGAFLLCRKRRRRGGRPGSIAPTETTYAGGGGGGAGFHSISGGSPVSRTGRGRFPSTSQSYLPTTTHGSPSEYGARVPEVQQAHDLDGNVSSSPTTTTLAQGDSSSRFLADPATFRTR